MNRVPFAAHLWIVPLSLMRGVAAPVAAREEQPPTSRLADPAHRAWEWRSAGGDYGWSTHGARYFMTDADHPDRALYVNSGLDGMMFDETTARLD